jgi:hypothetical protein
MDEAKKMPPAKARTASETSFVREITEVIGG